MRRRKALLIAMMVAAVLKTEAAVPRLTLSKVGQDATTHCVTVDYALDSPAIVTIDVTTNGVSIGAANVTCAYGDVNRLVGGGAHRLHWSAAKSWPGQRFVDDTVSVEVSAWSPDSPPDYMVVDLKVN